MGKGQNHELVRELCASPRKDFGMKVRVGGGIRTVSRAKNCPMGASRSLWKRAFRKGKVNAGFLRRLARKFLENKSSSLRYCRETSPFTAGALESRFRPKK